MIKCVLVDVDTVLISEVVEMDAELGDPNCKLINPYLFNSSLTLFNVPFVL